MSESHRKWTPMIVSDEERPTDAAVAARWAAEALQDGRYELGAALANIARNANRAEQANRAHDARTDDHERTAAAERARMVPMLGQTREEQPRDLYARLARPVDEQAVIATPMWDAALAPPLDAGQRMQDEPAPAPTSPPPAAVPHPAAAEAATEVFGAPTSPAFGGPAATKCAGEVIHDRGTERFREACPSPVYWHADGSNPDNGTWRHIDPAYDNDHIPVPLQG